MALTVSSPFSPRGDQPTAIEGLVEGLNDGLRYQTLLGATGTGKNLYDGEDYRRGAAPCAYLSAE